MTPAHKIGPRVSVSKDDIKDFLPAEEIRNMVDQKLAALKTDLETHRSEVNVRLSDISKHLVEVYGNGSGKKGALDNMKDVQDERWAQQQTKDDERWKKLVTSRETVDQALMQFKELYETESRQANEERKRAEEERKQAAFRAQILQEAADKTAKEIKETAEKKAAEDRESQEQTRKLLRTIALWLSIGTPALGLMTGGYEVVNRIYRHYHPPIVTTDAAHEPAFHNPLK